MQFSITTNNRFKLNELSRRCFQTNIIALSIILLGNSALAQAPVSKISIDRAKKELSVFRNGKSIQSSAIGIGRGGTGKKQSMADNVTPAGIFEVDIILSDQPTSNKVSEKLLRRYHADKSAISFLSSGQGLKRLFDNMNSLDFNGDGKADTAYGAAYIGLNAKAENKDAITGPKFSKFGGTDYWFSIALHGTPNEAKNIGNSNSGGCVHVPKTTLQKLISDGSVKIGTIVEIK